MKNIILIFCSWLFVTTACSHNNGSDGGNTNPANVPALNYWLTNSDGSILLQPQKPLAFDSKTNNYSFIEIDSTKRLQPIDGFGYTLTGGSAFVINHMSSSAANELLTELFGTENNSIGISCLRLSIGASDLNASVFSYDDMPAGQTDLSLAHFSLSADTVDLIPVLKKILLLNPSIKIIAAPWSPPVWMKTNNSSVGGNLKQEYYQVYADYFVKYILQMKANGITINAVTPQNEPLNAGNNPSLYMQASDEAAFIKNNLAPAFKAAGLETKIIVYDHNCDHTDYPLSIYNDAAALKVVDGAAFHLYAGDIAALSTVHNMYPDKNLYFTEQYTASTGDFGGDLKWHLKNVIIGSMRNWSRIALEWNLANDPSYGPHTQGGCNTCKGAITINGNAVTRNVGYYIIAHASKFIPAGSTCIASNLSGNLQNAAFITPAGTKVLIVENDGNDANFNIRYNNKWATVSLPAGAVATFTW